MGSGHIRTPSLDAAELKVFGSDYHSFKLEHLHVFSPESLAFMLSAAGLSPSFMTTESHMLRGFLGDRTSVLGASLQGSDIFCAAQAC